MSTTADKKKRKKQKFISDDSDTRDEPSTSKTYKPPPGYKPIPSERGMEEFDWDSVASNPELEIWAIRLPESLKPKHIDNMTFPLPKNSSQGPIARITAGKKQTQYDITVASEATGGEEMKGLTCLLPRESKEGKLFVAPKPLAGQLVFSEIPPTPQEKHLRSTLSPLPLPSSKRYVHPPETFKHRFVPTLAREERGAEGDTRATGSNKRAGEEGQEGPQEDAKMVGTEGKGGEVRPHKKRKTEEGRGKKGKKGKESISTY